MNPLNYATLEASRRLVEAGIVFEAEVSWYERETFFELDLTENYDYHNGKKIPAHSMAEVWRELNDYRPRSDGESWWLCDNEGDISHEVRNINPTDALIYLLIWVRKEAKHE